MTLRSAEGELGRTIGRLFGVQQEPDGRSNGEPKPLGLHLTEMDYRDRRQVQRYIDFLLDWRNLPHFTNVPESVEALRERVKSGGQYFLVAKERDVVGGVLIEDSSTDQEDGWLSLAVVDSDKQKQGKGREMLTQTLDWAYFNKNSRGQWRNKIDLAIILGVEGSKRMENLVAGKNENDIGLGFRLVHTLPRQARVPVRETLPEGDINQIMATVNEKYRSPTKEDKPRRIFGIRRPPAVKEAMTFIESGKLKTLEQRFGIKDLTEVVVLVARPDGKYEVVTREFRPARRFELWLIRTPQTKKDAPVWQEMRGLPDRESIEENAS